MRTRICIITFIIISGCFLNVESADWLRWRGPNGTGISEETNWNPGAMKNSVPKLWQVNLGEGWSAVAVQGNYLYSMGNIDDHDIVYCLNVNTGKEIWRYSYKCKAGNFPGPRATPVIDGEHVYTLSREGHLYCLDAQSGKLKWQKNLMTDYTAASPTWGFAASVVIDGNSLIVNACSNGISLHKITGKTIWASKPGTGGYAAPVIYSINNKKYVAIFGMRAIFGVDFQTGEPVWSYPWVTEYDINAADPIIIDAKIFISSGYQSGCALLDISQNKPKLIWQNKNMSNQFGSSIYLNGYIFGPDGNCGRSSSSLNCIDFKTGKLMWSQNLGFNSIVYANGYLLVITEKGELALVEANENDYKEISINNVLSGSRKYPCWTAPVLSNSRIYCRCSNGDLISIDVRK